jgi:hypothetical protein
MMLDFLCERQARKFSKTVNISDSVYSVPRTQFILSNLRIKLWMFLEIYCLWCQSKVWRTGMWSSPFPDPIHELWMRGVWTNQSPVVKWTNLQNERNNCADYTTATPYARILLIWWCIYRCLLLYMQGAIFRKCKDNRHKWVAGLRDNKRNTLFWNT